MPIRAVMFDLGYTLMHAVAPDLWPEVIRRGNQAMMDHLCKFEMLSDCDDLTIEFNQRLRNYYSERDDQMIETSTFLVLKELLNEKGYVNLSDNVIRESLDAHYAVTQKNWRLEKDAPECLKTMHERKYKLGIISNAGDDKDVQQLVAKFKIDPFFDLVQTSAACGYRKPHHRIFELALEFFNARAEEVAMVGDKLDADILGANQMGMYSIWITRRIENPPKPKSPAIPHSTISSLAELPGLLQQQELANLI